MTIHGSYCETLFRNESTGYTIFKIELSDYIPEFSSIRIVCKGYISYSLVCLPLKLTGEVMNDDRGDFLEVSEIEPCVKDKKEAVDFLCSSCCKGISERLAKDIISVVGDDLFSLPNRPDAYTILTSINGIGVRKAKNVINALSQATNHKTLWEYLKPYGGTFMTSEKLLIKYGADALSLLKDNPYLIGKTADMSFMARDCLARDLGLSESSDARVNALINETIEKDYNSGNAYITLQKLYDNIDYLSKRKSAFAGKGVSLFQVVCACDNSKDIVTEIKDNEIRYYFRKSYESEIKTAKNIKRLEKNKKQNDVNVERIIKLCERELKITYSEKQKECFNFLTSNGLKIITGGPGTGKSTVINGLTYAYRKLYPKNNIVMMAPTGRAAQRINEITGHEAGTIHRMLGIAPYGEDGLQTNYYADYPADMIIVDESSMIDNELMSVLTDSIKSSCLLIMVGDIDQLPSIGAGSVLRDMINAGVETVTLDVNYRQKGKSVIIENASAVNSGNAELSNTDEFQIQNYLSSNGIVRAAEDLFLELYDSKEPYCVQILCPQNKGTAGTSAINKKLQEELKSGKNIIANRFCHFNIGDKIMATKNNYSTGYFNGDVGLIIAATEVAFTVSFCGKPLVIPRENIEDFQLAYACTIHKSQGSEYDTVIICLPKEADCMTKRNLLYTAITRAKKRVYIFTQQGCVDAAVSRVTTDTRASGLVEKIVA